MKKYEANFRCFFETEPKNVKDTLYFPAENIEDARNIAENYLSKILENRSSLKKTLVNLVEKGEWEGPLIFPECLKAEQESQTA